MKEGWPMKFVWDQFVLLAILCSGLFLRIYHLGGESLWYDEVISVRLAHMTPSEIIVNRAGNVHPPFYFLVLRGWVALFGDSEFAVRLLSVVFGCFAVFMIYKVGRLLFDKEVGILASLLLAISAFHIQYSQEARAYSLLVLLTLFSFYFFLQLPQGRNHWISVGYVLSSALLAYTHYYGLFVLVAQNLYFASSLFFPRKGFELTLRKWLILQSLIVLLFAPWIPILIHQVSEVKSGFWIAPPSKNALWRTFRQYGGSKVAMNLGFLLAFLSIATLNRARGGPGWKRLGEWLASFRQRIILTDLGKIWLLSCWLFIPILLPFFVSQVVSPIYSDKYTIMASSAFYLLIAKGTQNLAYKPAKIIVVTVIIILSFINVKAYYGKVHKEQWREVASYVDTSGKPGDLILFNSGRCMPPFDYYSRRSDLIKKPFPEINRKVDDVTIKGLIPIVKDRGRVWLILSHHRDPKELIVRTLGKIYSVAYHHKFKGIEVYLFEKGKQTLRSRTSKQSLFGGCEIRDPKGKEACAG